MRKLRLLSMVFFCTNYAMENGQEEPAVCGSVVMGYCVRIAMGNAQERIGLLAGQAPNGGNIQDGPPIPIEEQTCRECYQNNKKKVWCCSVCCCLTCTCMTATSIHGIVDSVKTMHSWFMN